jgi:hypothetical protein
MAAKDQPVRNVLIEVKHSNAVLASAMGIDGSPPKPLKENFLKNLSCCKLDTQFGAIEIPLMLKPNGTGTLGPDPFDLSFGQQINPEHESNTFLVRSTVLEKDLGTFEREVKNDKTITGYFADPLIEEADVGESSDADVIARAPKICPASPPLGTARHVAARIGVPWLRRRRMDGRGVFLAIVDTGINLAHLRSKGLSPRLDPHRSWMARSGDTAGNLPVGHGTMVAYDAMIAAPRATLLDIALLRSTRRGGSVMAGLLSDAIKAYAHLYRIIRRPFRPGTLTSLVVNNSWGMFHDSWDFPIGHPGRYADNPAHPFNRIVGVLEHAGADILFAAGNCGRECPDGRCRSVTNAGIYGANSHPLVTTVAGVDVLKRRVGYSTSGPGKLQYLKPDVCGYTHFRGSDVYSADGGTSAATPVVAGLVAAFRSRFPFNPADFRTSPAAICNLLTRTAEDRGSIGFDFDFGWGIADGHKLALIRSLSVMQPQDEAASDITEFTDVETVLDRIDGLDEVKELMPEVEVKYEEPMPEPLVAGEWEPAQEVEELNVSAEHVREGKKTGRAITEVPHSGSELQH